MGGPHERRQCACQRTGRDDVLHDSYPARSRWPRRCGCERHKRDPCSRVPKRTPGLGIRYDWPIAHALVGRYGGAAPGEMAGGRHLPSRGSLSDDGPSLVGFRRRVRRHTRHIVWRPDCQVDMEVGHQEQHAVRRVILAEHNDSPLPSTHPRASHLSRRRTVRRHRGQRLADVCKPACAGGSPVRHALGSQRSRDTRARGTSRRARGSGVGAGVPSGCSRPRLRRWEHVPDGKSRDGGVGQRVGRLACRIPYRSPETGFRTYFLPLPATLSTASSLSQPPQM